MPIASAARAAAGSARTGRAHVLDMPFEMRGLAHAENAAWDASAKAYVWRGDALPPALNAYRAMPYSWESYQEDMLNAREPVDAPPEMEVVPRPHQVEAMRAILAARERGHPGFLVADDVGLGKTIETWRAVLDMDDDSVLVVAPLNALANWRRTIRWMGNGGRRVVIINYDRLKKLFEVPDDLRAKAKGRRRGKPRKVRTQKGVARFGTALGFDLVIWDESQKRRRIETARSALARRVDEQAGFVLSLSATAGVDPLELAYLAPLLAAATGDRVRDLQDYEEWCRGKGIGVSRGAYGRWRWAGHCADPTDPAQLAASTAAWEHDLPLVRGMLFGGEVPVGIRRTPQDVAGWPAMELEVMPAALDGPDRADYERAWDEFRTALDLSPRGADPANALVRQLRFRQKASLLRTAATVDLVRDLVGQGRSVAVSVQFLESLDVMRAALEAAGLACATIRGAMPPAAREAERMRFQADRAPVCLYTVVEAINLHQGETPEALRPRANVIHDVRWSAIDMHQIAGRTHRDGKFSRAYWMVAEDTVEERVAQVVSEKVRSMGTMQGDDAIVAEIERAILARSARPAA